jgi:DNA-directed RNA polymerase subunit N (RpoN/RPB10)
MSNQIGELFKILGKNEIFANYAKEVENGKTNQEIIDIAVNDEALMCTLTMVISDVELIKNKMEVIIGQKRKNYEKKIASETKEKSIVVDTKSVSNTDCKENLPETDEEQEQEQEEVIEFKHKPINPDNVIWLNNYIYMERVKHQTRLVTTEFEIYY